MMLPTLSLRSSARRGHGRLRRLKALSPGAWDGTLRALKVRKHDGARAARVFGRFTTSTLRFQRCVAVEGKDFPGSSDSSGVSRAGGRLPVRLPARPKHENPEDPRCPKRFSLQGGFPLCCDIIRVAPKSHKRPATPSKPSQGATATVYRCKRGQEEYAPRLRSKYPQLCTLKA